MASTSLNFCDFYEFLVNFVISAIFCELGDFSEFDYFCDFGEFDELCAFSDFVEFDEFGEFSDFGV